MSSAACVALLVVLCFSGILSVSSTSSPSSTDGSSPTSVPSTPSTTRSPTNSPPASGTLSSTSKLDVTGKGAGDTNPPGKGNNSAQKVASCLNMSVLTLLIVAALHL